MPIQVLRESAAKRPSIRAPLCGSVCVCVCTPWNHRDPFGLFSLLEFLSFQQGTMACVQGPCPTKLPDARDMRADLSHVPAIFQFSEWREAEPRTSLGRQVRPSSPCRFVVDLRLWPPFLLKTSRLRWSLLVLLGHGTLGQRVAPLSVPYTYLTCVWPCANPG